VWEIWAKALALLLILEGITPFLSPRQLRKTLTLMLSFNDQNLRMLGFSSMGVGLFLLYMV